MYDDIPDKTVDELEEDEIDIKDLEEFKEEMADVQMQMLIIAAAAMLGRMAGESDITLRQYFELCEILEEYERELDYTLL